MRQSMVLQSLYREASMLALPIVLLPVLSQLLNKIPANKCLLLVVCPPCKLFSELWGRGREIERDLKHSFKERALLILLC